jgi:hypothetical protein
MLSEANRIKTLIALFNGSGIATGQPANKIIAELNAILLANRVAPLKRKFILKVLHTTRSVDSLLKAFVTQHAITGGAYSIGTYIKRLEINNNPGLNKFSQNERRRYQERIADIRNDHMHNADSYPRDERAVNELIGEMHSLMARVFQLPI